jgi:peroxiredoxin
LVLRWAKNSKSVLFISICLCVLLADIALLLRVRRLEIAISQISNSFRASGSEGLEIGVSVPSLAFHDLNNSMVTLHDYLGKKVLAVFSSTTCEKCKQMYPVLKLFANRHTEIQVILISYGPIEINEQVFSSEAFSFPFLLSDDRALLSFKIPGVPFSYFVDELGNIQNSGFTSDLTHFEKLISHSKREKTPSLMSRDILSISPVRYVTS